LLTPADLRILLITLDDFLNSEGVSEAPLEEALENLVLLNKAKKELADIYDTFSTKMIHRMQDEKSTDIKLESGVELKCKAGSPRKSWDNENLLKVVYDRIQKSSIDMDSGEVMLSQEEIILKLLDYIQPSYWRVGALNELGVNADQYCEVGEPKTNIAIYTKGEKQ
jgi:hypothetical protein